jgi:hypothetical protein
MCMWKHAMTSSGPSIAEISDEIARKRCSNALARSANLCRSDSLMLPTRDEILIGRGRKMNTHSRICALIARDLRASDANNPFHAPSKSCINTKINPHIACSRQKQQQSNSRTNRDPKPPLRHPLPQAICLELRLHVSKERREVLPLGDPLALGARFVRLEGSGVRFGVGVCPCKG